MSALKALKAALPFLKEAAAGEWAYGSFHGGDPRDFKPDPECSTDEERKAWREACAKAKKDDKARSLDDTHRWLPLEKGGAMHVQLSGFGLGSYRWRNPKAEKALAIVRASIKALSRRRK